MENYRTILNHDNYEVDQNGNVRNKKRGTILKPSTNNKDYLRVNLTNNDGIQHNHLIHRLVAEAFIGKIPKDMQVDHIDRNKLNNNLKNLRIVTTSENNRNKSKFTKRPVRYTVYDEDFHVSFDEFDDLELGDKYFFNTNAESIDEMIIGHCGNKFRYIAVNQKDGTVNLRDIHGKVRIRSVNRIKNYVYSF